MAPFSSERVITIPLKGKYLDNPFSGLYSRFTYAIHNEEKITQKERIEERKMRSTMPREKGKANVMEETEKCKISDSFGKCCFHVSGERARQSEPDWL